MNGIRYGEPMNVIPVLAPQNITTTATWTAYVDLDLAHWVTFVVNYGSLSSAGATCDDLNLTVVCSSLASTASTTAIDFKYRLSAAVATNSWGAITAGTSDGITVGPAADNMSLVVDVDPATVWAKSSVKRFVAIAMTAASTATFVAATAFVEPRFPGNSIPSSS